MDELTIKELNDRQNWGYDERGFSYKQRYVSALEKEIARLKDGIRKIVMDGEKRD